jgi:hypothetical protein
MSYYDVKNSIDNFLYCIFNYVSDLIFLSKIKERKLVKANKTIKDIHLGQRCFILGTGPSLNELSDEQVEKLKKEITFGVNSLYKAKVVDNLTPQYYALFDNFYWQDGGDFIVGIKKKYAPNIPVFLLDYRMKEIIDNLDVKPKAIYLYSKKYPYKKIDCCIDKNMYMAQNVIPFSILIAMYMGFKDIYLLGCDYNSFLNESGTHAYDDTEEINFNSEYNLAFYLKFYGITTNFHYLIAKLSKSKGVRIVNITPGSLLDAYHKKDVSSIL